MYMEEEQMTVEPSCECSTGKRPLDIRMILKYIVKKNSSALVVVEFRISVSLFAVCIAIGHGAAPDSIYFSFPQNSISILRWHTLLNPPMKLL